MFPKVGCPSYCPFFPDTNCRICGLDITEHQKYYIYSNYARKIQKVIIVFLYKKFIKRNYKKIKKFFCGYFIACKKIYYKYYRRWHIINIDKLII
jgi:hypothetical protein